MNSVRIFRYATAAPLILCLIAGLQIYRAHAFNLSAWKGGGFGMFSTIDRPSWRIARGYIVTDSSRTPIGSNELGLSSELNLRLRTMPTNSLIFKSQKQLSKHRWATYHMDSLRTSLQALPVDMLESSFSSEFTEWVKSPSNSFTSNLSQAIPPYIAFATHSDPTFDGDSTQVHIEVWRMRFDATESKVYGEQLY